MAFDFKKEYRQLYAPQSMSIVSVPAMSYIAVEGKGDPNEANGEYARSIDILYAIAYTLKMSARLGKTIDGFYEYVVPPLEGFWQQDVCIGIDYAHKENFRFTSCIRLPDFVTDADFVWAVETASRKKRLDCSAAAFVTLSEGECVQALHVGSYDDEPKTVAAMHAFAESRGYAIDLSETRRHHEIYLSDPRKCARERCKTVIRLPIRKL